MGGAADHHVAGQRMPAHPGWGGEATHHPPVAAGAVRVEHVVNGKVPAAIQFDDVAAAIASPIAVGIVLGQLIGKPLGVLGTAWLVTKSKLGNLAHGLEWADLRAVAWLFGMCFTVSLLMAQLAFPAGHSDAGASAFTEQSHSIGVLSVFVATSVSALISTILMRRRASVLAKGSVNV